MIAGQFLDVSVQARGRADVDAAMSDRQTPLFVAAQSGHADTVAVLLEASVDVSVRVANPSPIDPTASGLTALGVARACGHDAVVAALLAAGASE